MLSNIISTHYCFKSAPNNELVKLATKKDKKENFSLTLLLNKIFNIIIKYEIKKQEFFYIFYLSVYILHILSLYVKNIFA